MRCAVDHMDWPTNCGWRVMRMMPVSYVHTHINNKYLVNNDPRTADDVKCADARLFYTYTHKQQLFSYQWPTNCGRCEMRMMPVSKICIYTIYISRDGVAGYQTRRFSSFFGGKKYISRDALAGCQRRRLLSSWTRKKKRRKIYIPRDALAGCQRRRLPSDWKHSGIGRRRRQSWWSETHHTYQSLLLCSLITITTIIEKYRKKKEAKLMSWQTSHISILTSDASHTLILVVVFVDDYHYYHYWNIRKKKEAQLTM